MPKKISPGPLALILAAVFSGGAWAAADGTTSAAFLKLPVGARNAAMGGTGAAEGSVYSVYWNPAGLAELKRPEAAYSYTSWLAGISHQFLGSAARAGGGVVGVSAQYVSVPAIDKYDNTGAAAGSRYRPLDSLASLSYAREFHGVAAGVTLKGIYSRLDDRSARTLAADAGLRAAGLLDGTLAVGLAVQNAGQGLKYDQERAPLPLNLKAGAAYRPYKGLTLCADANKARGSDPRLSGGVEYMLAAGGDVSAGPRAGYETGRSELGAAAGLTAGVGVNLRGFSFDYAFAPMGDFGDAHRLSLKARF